MGSTSRKRMERKRSSDIMLAMAKNIIHISEAEAASDFAAVLARVRAGAEIVIEDDARPVAVVRAAERRGDTVEQLIEQIVNRTGDQEAALSAIGLTELIHGIYRARTPEMRLRRETF